ncbi:hypothetical protein ACFTZJ_21900 [Streptomyces globisporus]|uniref:hypothetical protein n=1 Tax=Streptomyces globisporus TaxID=1908 RepID=UPI003626BD15
MTDEQIDSVVRNLIHTHNPDSYRQLEAKFRTTTYRASSKRLHASWVRVHSNQNPTRPPAHETP